jgi:hypothetical protein
MFQRSTAIPSRRSSVNDVTLHTSAAIPKSDSSSSAAASTSFKIVPEPSSWTRGASSRDEARSRYMPRRIPSGASSGIAGW